MCFKRSWNYLEEQVKLDIAPNVVNGLGLVCIVQIMLRVHKYTCIKLSQWLV